MRGRKPAPTKLRVIRGNPGKRPLPKDEPQVEAATPQPPAVLSERARTHWETVVGQLSDVGVMTHLDVDALAMYCEAYATWADAHAKIQEFGPVVKAQSGMPTQSPYLTIANKAFDQMRAMLVEFGMTPSSRTRVTAAKDAPEENPTLKRFQNR